MNLQHTLFQRSPSRDLSDDRNDLSVDRDDLSVARDDLNCGPT